MQFLVFKKFLEFGKFGPLYSSDRLQLHKRYVDQIGWDKKVGLSRPIMYVYLGFEPLSHVIKGFVLYSLAVI